MCPRELRQDRGPHGPFGLFRQAGYLERPGAVPAAADRHVPRRTAAGPRARAAHPAAGLEPGHHPARWLWTKLALLGRFIAALTAAARRGRPTTWPTCYPTSAGQTCSGTGVPGHRHAPAGPQHLLVRGRRRPRRRHPPHAAGRVRRIAGFIGADAAACQWRYPTLMKPLSAYRQVERARRRPAARQRPDRQRRHRSEPTAATNRQDCIDAAGHPLTGADLERLCPPDNRHPEDALLPRRPPAPANLQYQPGSRIPEFHLIVERRLPGAHRGGAARGLADRPPDQPQRGLIEPPTGSGRRTRPSCRCPRSTPGRSSHRVPPRSPC